MCPRLPVATKVYIHDPERRGIIYRRGVVWASYEDDIGTLYNVRVKGAIYERLIREQLLTEAEMEARQAQGL